MTIPTQQGWLPCLRAPLPRTFAAGQTNPDIGRTHMLCQMAQVQAQVQGDLCAQSAAYHMPPAQASAVLWECVGAAHCAEPSHMLWGAVS